MSAKRIDADPHAIAGGSDPFVEAQSDKFYCITPALRQRIDLVRHLIDFGRQIIMLTGPPGAGKSMLLGRVTEAQEKNWRVIRFVAGPTLNQASLLTKIANELGIERPAGDVGALLESIRKRVITASQRGETTILAIDDADALPVDTSACLAQLAHSVDESAELKVLLGADPAQSPLIDRLQSETSQHALVHVVEIPRLNDEQTGAMLRHRWTAAYGNDEIPLSSIELSQIHRQSNGIAGKAIVLARQVQILSNNRVRPLRDPAQRYLIGGLAVIVLFVVFAFFNQDDRSGDEDAQIHVELPAARVPVVELPALTPAIEVAAEPREDPPAPSESDPALTAAGDTTAAPAPSDATTPIAMPPPLEQAAAAAPGSPPADKSSVAVAAPHDVTQKEPSKPGTTAVGVELATPVQPVTAHKPVKPAAPAKPIAPPAAAADDEPATPVQPVAAQEPVKPVAPAKPIAPATTAKKPTRKAAQSARSETYSIDWLRSQPAAGYVLQLFGVRDRVAATKFIKDRKIGDKSAVLVTAHAGEPWFVVVFGYYPDRASAQAAIPNLPSNLTTAKPWARPIASLN